MADLTDRQRQIVKQIALGYENKQIGVRLGISVETVKSQIRNIFARLGAVNRANAVYLYFLSEGESSVHD